MDSIKQGEAVKHDTGKPDFSLLPVGPLFELVSVYTMGSKKYGAYNWAKGIAYGRIFAAMMRHAWKFWRGERHDPEDGQHHLSSVAWCAFTLMHFDLNEEQYGKFDDRPKTNKG